MTSRVLVAGASSDIGLALLPTLLSMQGVMVGAHCFKGADRLRVALASLGSFDAGKRDAKIFESNLLASRDSFCLVDDFVSWAGGIDVLVQLIGNVSALGNWEELSEDDWNADIAVNLSTPFFLSQRAFKYMKSQGGGRIVLMSTASATHGGGQETLAYGVAKAGIECLVKGLAKGGAPLGILVNGVAPGFIDTRFHRDRLRKNEEAMGRRAQLVPLRRAGLPEDVAHVINFLISPRANYITGETIVVSGGDWL
jgi:3-oxoacyl-[acyl-carrier protein] reductase